MGRSRSASFEPLSRLKYALLFNPIAGRGAAVAIATEVADLLGRAGHDVAMGRSERAGHIEEMGREHGATADRILVLGGDGSLREAAKGLLQLPQDQRAALAVLPFGSGNVVARELQLSLDPVQAARTVMDLEPISLDVGYAAADGRAAEPFLAMAGAGFDAAVAAGIARMRARTFGARWYRRGADSLYAALATREMLRFRTPRFDVALAGETVAARATAAIVSNVETYAKGMTMSPGARADDGLLDLHVRRSQAPWSTAVAHLQAQRRRPAPHWAVAPFKAASAILTASEGSAPFPWQLDGDAMGTSRRIELSVERGALRVVGTLAPGM